MCIRSRSKAWLLCIPQLMGCPIECTIWMTTNPYLLKPDSHNSSWEETDQMVNKGSLYLYMGNGKHGLYRRRWGACLKVRLDLDWWSGAAPKPNVDLGQLETTQEHATGEEDLVNSERNGRCCDWTSSRDAKWNHDVNLEGKRLFLKEKKSSLKSSQS